MKTFRLLLVFALTQLGINTASAQYGGSGYGNSNNGYGNSSGRISQMGQTAQTPEKPKEIPIEETVAKIMERMTPALSLDALQEIAIGNVVAESMRTQGILLKDDSSQDQKIEEFKALAETTDRKINEYLNPEQKEKYKQFAEDVKNPKKSKKKK